LQDDFDILPEDAQAIEVKDQPEVQVRPPPHTLLLWAQKGTGYRAHSTGRRAAEWLPVRR